MPKYLSVGEIAKHFGKHRNTVRKWLKKGVVKASYYTPSGYAIINLYEVEQLFAKEAKRLELFNKLKKRLLRK